MFENQSLNRQKDNIDSSTYHIVLYFKHLNYVQKQPTFQSFDTDCIHGVQLSQRPKIQLHHQTIQP